MPNLHTFLSAFAVMSSLLLACARGGPVERYGPLRVDGSHIVGRAGTPVSLAGNSLYWSQWEGAFWNPDCINWLKTDWKSDIIRAAVAVDAGGYLEHPEEELARVERVVDACIAADLYVIIDWHDHEAHKHAAEAETFFRRMAARYGDRPHVIYEIFNEPKQISWSNDVKPYSERIVAAIRAIDPDNLIVVGSPQWSQDVDVAAQDPVHGTNIAYALHFYAGTHKQWLRDKAEQAMRRGIALIVTEWGTCAADGAGEIDAASTREWMDFMRKWQISHCNWAVSNKDETTSILRPGGSPNGGWAVSDLTESGKLVRQIVREWSDPFATTNQMVRR